MEDLGDFDSNIDMADSIEVKKVLFQVLCVPKLKDYGFEVWTMNYLESPNICLIILEMVT